MISREHVGPMPTVTTPHRRLYSDTTAPQFRPEPEPEKEPEQEPEPEPEAEQVAELTAAVDGGGMWEHTQLGHRLRKCNTPRMSPFEEQLTRPTADMGTPHALLHQHQLRSRSPS